MRFPPDWVRVASISRRLNSLTAPWNPCGLGAGDLDYIIDNTPFKQGKLAPGSWIPVRNENELLNDQPDYALLLAWNEYLYAFLLLSDDKSTTLGVALGSFLSADDSPWELLMTTGLIYALPPAAIYYVFKRYMVSGLTAGAVKS